MPLRQSNIILAEGQFQVVLTNQSRVFAVIDAPHTALGPIQLALEVDRHAYARALALRHELGHEYVVSGLFDDIGHAFSHVVNDLGHNLGHTLEHVAEGAFNAAAKAATGIAQPAFDIVHHVAATGMHLIAQQLPFLPEGARKAIESASRIVMRARLGDIKAKDFIHGIIHAVKSGVDGARKIGDALLTGSRLVAHVLDVPMRIMEHIPGVGGVMKNFSPFEKFAKMTTLVQRGDFSGLKKMVTDDVKMAQGVISLFPGIGTGISSALSAGMAILDGGGPLEIAIKTAYGAIPIPPGVRTITDAVLDGVLTLATKHGSLTDAVLAAARDAVPNGFPRQVFDTLANLVIKHRPIAKVAGDLLNHYVGQYVGQIKVGGEIPTHDVDVAAVTHSTRLVQPLARMTNADEGWPVASTALALG